MRFYRGLYMSPSLRKKRNRIIWKLITGRPQPLVYVIALAKNNDLFEIYHSAILKQKYYRKRENSPYIVGIALGYHDAVELAAGILEDVYRITGGLGVKEFFKK